MIATTGADGPADGGVCWCCGQRRAGDQLVALGSHPEVQVCLRCAHSLHQRARQREDELRPSPGGRARDVVRHARGFVMARNLQHAPGIGPVLRWLGPRLP